MSMATTMEPVRDSQVPSWLFGPRTDVLAAPAPIGPLSNTGNVLCFNRNVSKLYNNSVVEKKTTGVVFNPNTTLKLIY